jgi:hypothetical protein
LVWIGAEAMAAAVLSKLVVLTIFFFLAATFFAAAFLIPGVLAIFGLAILATTLVSVVTAFAALGRLMILAVPGVGVSAHVQVPSSKAHDCPVTATGYAAVWLSGRF